RFQLVFHPPDSAPPATLLIRLMAGGVFLWEGVMKFVFPHTLGVGRFLKLGIPAPEFMAPFVGVMEIVGGTLFVLGLCTRLAALPLLIDIVLAVGSATITQMLNKNRLLNALSSMLRNYLSVNLERRARRNDRACMASRRRGSVSPLGHPSGLSVHARTSRWQRDNRIAAAGRPAACEKESTMRDD